MNKFVYFVAFILTINMRYASAQPLPFPYPDAPVTGGNCVNGALDCPVYTPYVSMDGISGQSTNNPNIGGGGATTKVVNTPLGSVLGTTSSAGAGATVFYGVPYAQNSVRFQMPQTAVSYPGGFHDGTAAYPDCVQGDGQTGTEFNCLHYDIFVPNNGAAPSGGWPVYVYYPGGSFVNTNSNDLSNIVNNTQQFIGLRGTYRVGPFGYLATPGASKEQGAITGIEASGNLAILDQVQGLKWVKQYISAFGGNPHKVTIGGESAGSWSVCQLLATPLAKGLFHQAIGESGNCDGGPGALVQYLSHQEDMGQLTATKAGCDLSSFTGNYTAQLACLRSVTATNLTFSSVNAGGEVAGLDHMTTPVVDGYVHPVPPQQNFWGTHGNTWNKVPVLVGSNFFETYVFNQAYTQNTPGFMDYSTAATLIQNFTSAYTCANNACPYVDEGAIESLTTMSSSTGTYGTTSIYGPVLGSYYALNTASSEGIIQCGMRRIASYAAAANVGNNYLYAFGIRGGGAVGDVLGPYHSAELNWVYGRTSGFSSDEILFAYVLQSYWSNFIANGDPNDSTNNALALSGNDRAMPSGYSWQAWPVYSTNGNPTNVLGYSNAVDNFTLFTNDYNNVYPECPYWDQTMPGATNHAATLFTPRKYTGYNEPGYNLPNPEFSSSTAASTVEPSATPTPTPTTTNSPHCATYVQVNGVQCDTGFSLTTIGVTSPTCILTNPSVLVGCPNSAI